jgi:hypothetical protein
MKTRWIFMLSLALLSGCAYLDSIPYSPDSVNDVAYGGRFKPVW